MPYRMTEAIPKPETNKPTVNMDGHLIGEIQRYEARSTHHLTVTLDITIDCSPEQFAKFAEIMKGKDFQSDLFK